MMSSFEQAQEDLLRNQILHPKQGELWFLLGASRGLGKAFYEQVIIRYPALKQVLVSRKVSQIFSSLQGASEAPVRIDQDFTKVEKWDEYVLSYRSFIDEHLRGHQPQIKIRFFYFAGGGPYGAFADKQFKDHQWAMRLNFEYPAFLLHSLMTLQKSLNNPIQMNFIGSDIAESQPDPFASSYCAGKHALKGLISSILQESWPTKSLIDLRLFSPGYMDTSMLPKQAWPRQVENLVADPHVVAKTLLDWILIDKVRDQVSVP